MLKNLWSGCKFNTEEPRINIDSVGLFNANYEKAKIKLNLAEL